MNVFTNFTSFTSPIQSPKVPVFDFVAWMCLQVLQVLQVPSKVPSACLWFCSMSVLTSFTRFYKSQSKVPSACLWFCSMSVLTSFTRFYKSSQSKSPKWPVFDFVAWVCWQVLQDFTSPSKVPSACLWFCSMSLFTRFTSQSKMSQMATLPKM